MCLSPKWIYKKGIRKETTFRGKEGESYEIGMYAKCGMCEQCIAEKSNNWVVRNKYEEETHNEKCFITLTYSNEYNPYILRKRDVQLFIKRLRRKIEPIKIRYFLCGEYGERHGRPHYHLIVYGWKPKDMKFLRLSNRKNICYSSNLIDTTWGMGYITVQEFNQAEIAYISLYNTNKKECRGKTIKLREDLKKTLLKRRKGTIDKKQQKRINEIIKELDEEQQKWKIVKEFNTWSRAIGWENFEYKYDKNKEQEFKHYIGNAELATPTPWLKKLANQWGEQNAIDEIKRREEIAKAEGNETDLNEIIRKAEASRKTTKERLERAENRAREQTQGTFSTDL